MIGKESIGPLLGACYAAVFDTLIIVGLHRYWPEMSIGVLVLLAGAVFVPIFFAGWRVAVRMEQNKKLPTSSKELRRRTKEFYDWLGSQGRPRPRR